MGQVTIDGIPVYRALVDAEDCGMIRISLVDDPAVQSNFLAFKKQEPARRQLYAVSDEDKRLVVGCVMRADFPIYRRDARPDGTEFEYYIIYKADTIRAMAEKYLLQDRQNNVDLMHDGKDVDGVQMVQYYIKDSDKGVNPAGFEDLADGSLFAEFHVTNDDVWAAIKDGTYKGFSLEGIFDLTPERDKASVEEIVEALDGVFSRIFNPKQYEKMSKVKGLLARLAKALVELGNVSTDKGVLSWDGDEDLKAGDNVYTEDENGERKAAPDGDYTTEDGKVIVVVDGKVSEIRDAAAEVAPAEEENDKPVEAGSVDTDKGFLEWDGEDDLKAGDAVYVRDDEGNRVAAPDGDYTTEDGKVIVVKDGKVEEIRDAKAEVAPEVEARREEAMSRKQKFEESYNEKFRLIAGAIAENRTDDFYIVDAGDDFAVVCAWGEDWVDHYFRYAVTWNEDGSANVADPVEVKSMFVPLDFESPFEAKEDTEKEELRRQVADLSAQVEELKKTPAAQAAHQEFTGTQMPEKTGNKGLDNLARFMAAK